MTEQEAQVFGERLERIWNTVTPLPDNPARHGKLETWGYNWWMELGGRVKVGANVYRYNQGRVDVWLRYYPPKGVRRDGQLSCRAGIIEEESLLDRQFAAQWLPFFRRGCWLSGCAIDASAHEKATWIEGFNREEVEGWNLKF